MTYSSFSLHDFVCIITCKQNTSSLLLFSKCQALNHPTESNPYVMSSEATSDSYPDFRNALLFPQALMFWRRESIYIFFWLRFFELRLSFKYASCLIIVENQKESKSRAKAWSVVMKDGIQTTGRDVCCWVDKSCHLTQQASIVHMYTNALSVRWLFTSPFG